MKTTSAMTVSLLAMAAPALAAGGGNEGGVSFLTMLFLGFGALIIVFQTVPAVILFSGMLKGIFSTKETEATGSADSK